MKKRWFFITTIFFIVLCTSLGAVVLLPREKLGMQEKPSLETLVVADEETYTGEDSADIGEKGGVVYLDNGSNYTMTTGLISNQKKKYGGAVYVGEGCTFTMNGGAIINNEAYYGGAIYVANGGTCIINGGTIENNGAEISPAIHVEPGGSLIINDPMVIKDNYTIAWYRYNLTVTNLDEGRVENVTHSVREFYISNSQITFYDEELQTAFAYNYPGNNTEYKFDCFEQTFDEINLDKTIKTVAESETATKNIVLENGVYKLTDNTNLIAQYNKAILFEYARDINNKEETNKNLSKYIYAREGEPITITDNKVEIKTEYTDVSVEYTPAVGCVFDQFKFRDKRSFGDIDFENGNLIVVPNMKIVSWYKMKTFIDNREYHYYEGSSVLYLLGDEIKIDEYNPDGNFESEYSFVPSVYNLSIAIDNKFIWWRDENKEKIAFDLTEENYFIHFENITYTGVENSNTFNTHYGYKFNYIVYDENNNQDAFRFSDYLDPDKNIYTYCQYGVSSNRNLLSNEKFYFYTKIEQDDIGLKAYENPYVYQGEVLNANETFEYSPTSDNSFVKDYTINLNEQQTITININDYEVIEDDDEIFGYMPEDTNFETISQYLGTATTVYIPSEAKNIGNRAFKALDIEEVYFTYGILTIGEEAFNGSYITLVSLPKSISSIGNGAFLNCQKLKSLTYGARLLELHSSVFGGCANIQYLKIDGLLTNASKDVFGGCDNLTTLEIESDVSILNNNAFKDCKKLSTLYYSANTTSLDESVFAGCDNIKTLTVSGALENVEKDLFGGCENLEELDLACVSISNKIYIEAQNKYRGAFQGLKILTDLTVGGNISTITEDSFRNCTSLFNLNLTGYDTLESIEDFAFSDSFYFNEDTSLPKIIFKDLSKLTSIGNSAFSGTGIDAVVFDNCPKLNFLGQSVFKESSIATCDMSGITSDIAIPLQAFRKSSIGFNGSELIFPSNVTSIGLYAFAESSIVNVDLSNKTKLSLIDESAFDGCESLEKFDATGTTLLSTINDRCFRKCLNLDTVDFTNSGLTTICEEAFINCYSLSKFYLGNKIKTISDYAFAIQTKTPLTSEEKNIATYNHLIDSVEDLSLRSSNFAFYKKYGSINSFDVLDSIGNYAFFNRANMRYINLGNKIKTIGKYAFAMEDFISTSLNSGIDLGGSSLTTIKEGTFTNTGLLTFTMPNSVTTLEIMVFSGCSNLREMTLSNKLTSIPSLTFANTKLEKLIVPASVKTIQVYAFLNCSSLKSMRIESGTNCASTTYTGSAAGLLTALGITVTTAGVGAIALSSVKLGAVVGGAVGAGVGLVVGLVVGAIVEESIKNGEILLTAFFGCCRTDGGTNLTLYTDKGDPNFDASWRAYGTSYNWTMGDGNGICYKKSYSSYPA